MSEEHTSDMDLHQFWRMAVETWQSSGLSVRQFCRQEGLSEPSFYAWRKKLSAVEHAAIHPPAASSFIEVSLPPAKSGGLEVVLASGILLRVSSDTSRQVIGDVLAVLQQAGLC
jgi:transposase